MAFGSVAGGKIDIYRGVPETPELVKYIEGLLKIETRDRAKLLRYAFDHLEPKGTEAAADALTVFQSVAEPDLRAVAEKLDPAVLRKWLRKDPGQRTSLYARLLGYCGKPEDAALLRELLVDPNRTVSDGLLIGYVLLDKKAGYTFLTTLFTDPEQEFLVKHAALKTLRFFWTNRSDVLSRKQLLDGMLALTAEPDIADMPIDDLRRWKVWEFTKPVLYLATVETHNALPINRRAILKFAIAASWADPKNAAAVEFVAEARKNDPERVKMLEEILRDELALPVAPPPRTRAGK